MSKTLVVIGGGAAGFFCAVNAARLNPALNVILLEKTSKLLTKVKVSGGGRCNVTHACFDRDELANRYPRGKHFVKKLFYKFYSEDTIAWFNDRGVELKTEADGRMFPQSNTSQTIIESLLREAEKHRVDIRMNAQVNEILPQVNGFMVHLQNQKTIKADFLCIAAGGYPKLSMFDWLKFTNHTIETPVPSLFTFNIPRHPITELMGISLENVHVKIKDTKLEQLGPLLITHWGLSGPAVLKLSAWGARILSEKNYQFSIRINWTGEENENEVRESLVQYKAENGTTKVGAKNQWKIPTRLWKFLLHEAAIEEEMTWATLPQKSINKWAQILSGYELQVNGKTTFKEEFVTAGGIKLSEIDANTMMSKKIENLFFAGEIIDVDGITGGYNFQNAWSTGFVAAQTIAEKSL